MFSACFLISLESNALPVHLLRQVVGWSAERAMGGLLGLRSVLLGIPLGRASGPGMLERLFEVSIDVQCMLSNFP